jgi:ABC-type Na+ efflux pump permease subunit
VERGVLTAAVIVPTDFTARLTGSTGADSGAEGNATPARLEVRTYLGRPIAAEIVRSVVADVGRQFAAGSVAVRALMETVPEEVSPGTVFSTQAFAHGMGSLQAGQGARVTISQESVSGNEGAFNPLVFFGATQAIFFALFAANGSANSVMEEHREGTLLRLLSSPTRQEQILLGKLVGTVGMILLQLLLLFVAFTAVGSLFEGTLTFIWGRQVGAILLSVVAAAMATAGVGIIVAAAAKDPEQASTIGSITALFMATVGGAFGFQVGPPIAYASVVYWGSRTFSKLAAGDGAIATELAVMVAFGIVAFAGGLAIFRARLRA